MPVAAAASSSDDVDAPADDGDAVVGPVQGADQLGLPGGAGDGGEDLECHQPVGPARARDVGTSAIPVAGPASTESCTTTTSGRPAIEVRTSAASSGRHGHDDLHGGRRRGEHPVGPAGDRLHRAPAGPPG